MDYESEYISQNYDFPFFVLKSDFSEEQSNLEGNFFKNGEKFCDALLNKQKTIKSNYIPTEIFQLLPNYTIGKKRTNLPHLYHSDEPLLSKSHSLEERVDSFLLYELLLNLQKKKASYDSLVSFGTLVYELSYEHIKENPELEGDCYLGTAAYSPSEILTVTSHSILFDYFRKISNVSSLEEYENRKEYSMYNEVVLFPVFDPRTGNMFIYDIGS